jgi:hypothetical protein
MRKRLTFANVTSFVALFVALSTGGSYAATTLLGANSVGSKQLKANAVTAAKIAKNAVTSSKIAPGTIVSGAGVAFGLVKVTTVTAPGTVPAGAGISASATCPSGQSVVGGGANLGNENEQAVNDTYPSAANRWTVDVSASTAGAGSFTVYAICVPTLS